MTPCGIVVPVCQSLWHDDNAKKHGENTSVVNFVSVFAEICRTKEANKEADKRKKTQDLENCVLAAKRKLNEDKVSVGKLTQTRG